MYYKLGLYDQALTSLEKGSLYAPPENGGQNQVLYISAVLYEWLFATALKVNDTERIPLRQQLCRPRAWRTSMEVDPTGHYPVTSALFQALSFPEKGQIKRRDDCWMRQSGFIHPKSGQRL